MTKKNHLLWALAALFASCNVYHPQVVDIPLLHEQGQIQTQVSASCTEAAILSPAANATVSVAITDHIGMQAFGDVSSSSHYYGHLAGGYFTSLTDHMVLEAYLGIGAGHGHINGSRVAGTHTNHDGLTTNFTEEFLQLNWGMVNVANTTFDFGVGVRGGMLDNDTDECCYYEHYGENPDRSYHEHHLFAEPQVMVRYGWDRFRFSVQYAYGFLQDEEGVTRHFPVHRSSFSIGLSYRF